MMTNLRQKLMMTGLLTLGLMNSIPQANAQYNPGMIDTGSVIPNLKLNDISGKKVQLYDYLAEGYTVLLEVMNTSCPNCWNFKKTKILENVYNDYGPKGKVKPKKIMPILVEGDIYSSIEDLQGTGSRTLGDWVTGTSYPIVDLERGDTLLSAFIKGNNQQLNTPSWIIICPDRKLVYTAEGEIEMSEVKMRYFMEMRCAQGKPATGIDQILTSSSIQLFPNPTEATLQISVEAQSKATIQLSVSNLLGQTFVTNTVTLTPGHQTTSLNTSELAAGMYILSLITEQGMVQEKFIVK